MPIQVPPSKKHGAVDSKERADGSLDEQIDLPDQEKGTTDVIQQLIEDAGRGKHRARNKTTKSGGATQTGIVIAAIQERLKKARVVYVSATGVSEIRNLAYMTRYLLGLFVSIAGDS